MSVKILTANDLKTGQVVFYSTAGIWSPKVADAQVAHSDGEAEQLSHIGRQAIAAREVVEVEVIPALETENGPFPVRNREQIRALGPTVRPDLGYQAEGVNA